MQQILQIVFDVICSNYLGTERSFLEIDEIQLFQTLSNFFDKFFAFTKIRKSEFESV